jgi:hypothetical protein
MKFSALNAEINIVSPLRNNMPCDKIEFSERK